MRELSYKDRNPHRVAQAVGKGLLNIVLGIAIFAFVPFASAEVSKKSDDKLGVSGKEMNSNLKESSSEKTEANSIKKRPVKKTDVFEVVELPNDLEDKKERPKDLSRWYFGAKLLALQGGRYVYVDPEHHPNDPRLFLISDNYAGLIPIDENEKEFVVDLGNFYPIRRVIFNSSDIMGDVEVYTSMTLGTQRGTDWSPVVLPYAFDPYQNNILNFPYIEARYVRVVIKPKQGVFGNIYSFAVHGDQLLEPVDYNLDQDNIEDLSEDQVVPYDFANLRNSTQITHLSSGPLDNSSNMIDDDPESFYEFDKEDELPFVLLDLKKNRSLNKFSVTLEGDSGELEFYVLPDMPSELEEGEESDTVEGEEEIIIKQAYHYHNNGWRPLLLADASGGVGEVIALGQDRSFKKIKLTKEFLENLDPEVVAEFKGGKERIDVDFALTKGRFILVNWINGEGSAQALKIFSLNVMGPVPMEEELFYAPPESELIEATPDTTPPPTNPPPPIPPPSPPTPRVPDPEPEPAST